jgi:hypothetical protein
MFGNGAKLRSRQATHRQDETATNTSRWNALGQEFLTMWQQAHGAPQGVVSVMAAQNGLMVIIENAFSQAELALARQSTDNLLQQYIDSLTRQMLPMLTTRVEQVSGRQIGATSTTSNIHQNWMMVFLKFEEQT